jgi:uncharacterized protein (DUF885 family)
MRLRLLLSLAFLAGLLAAVAPGGAADAPAAGGFATFADDYFDALFRWQPSQATAVGLHQYDDRLEDLSAAAYAKRAQTLHALQERLDALRAGKLAPEDALDAEVLDAQIKAELQELEVVGSWKKDPQPYISVGPGAIDALMKRSFAPPADRLKSVVARLKATPAVLKAMRENVTNPPKEFTDLAVRMAGGSVGFYRETLAGWAKDAAGGDAKLLDEFRAANAAAGDAMAEAAAWLKKDLLPRSKGGYALGADNFRKKLRYEEMVDLPLGRLLKVGEDNLAKDYAAFVATARRIDATKSPAEVMRALSDDHPTAGDLIPSAKRTVEKIVRFIRDKDIVTIPSEVRPTIEETPPYARNGGFASMETPGAYETKATEAFYYVTPVEKEWDAKHREEHLRLFNAPVMQIITVHEAYPGHYVQFLNAKRFPTKTRKLITCGTNVEGWAHYTEQMMVEEGYGGGDPKVRLAQLSEALLRDCRFVVGIRLHTAGMTVEEGAKVFETKGFQEPAVAYEESRRGAYNPTYLYYTLGKLQIYRLREDYRQAKGKDYSLKAFHDAFLGQGGIPVKLVRRVLLPGAAGPEL